jgi:uncharacterized protein (DUF924 family)
MPDPNTERDPALNAETPATIHDFWFGPDAAAASDAVVAERQAALWWRKNPEVDAQMRLRFAASIAHAAQHALDDWAATPHGRLALILLTDQFTRNVYRNTPAAFAWDPLARAWCKDGLAAGMHRALRPIERVFFYLPLEHAEDLEDQERAVSLFRELLAEVPADERATFAGFLDFAERHRAVIARFGRFPHRNAILGRASTDEEVAFLAQPGSSF